MRKIKRSTAFKHDYKRILKGRYRRTLENDLKQALIALASDHPLEPRFRDHNLTGSWGDYRECHLQPDLLLIYRKVGDDILHLVRLGSHSNLFT
jgi:mRNA interferase YafQ